MGIDLFDVERLLLTEAAEPPLPFHDAEARDRAWERAVRANPALFDGPVVACGGLERTGPRILRLSWVRVTYRHYALRRVPGATALPSLFVNVVQLAPALPEATLRADFTAVSAAERVQGRVPELDDIALLRSPDELAGLTGPHADYLEPIVRRFAGCR